MKRIMPFIAVAFLLVGCKPVLDVIRTDSASRAIKADHEVEVLMETPRKEYKVIGMIQVGPDAFVADYASQTKHLVKEAAKLGADAVIVEYSSRTSGYNGMVAESKFTRGKAIIWK